MPWPPRSRCGGSASSRRRPCTGRVRTRPFPVAGGARALAWTVGASRVYVGVHYPGDVLGGMLMGRAVAKVWSRLVSPRSVGLAGTVTR